MSNSFTKAFKEVFSATEESSPAVEKSSKNDRKAEKKEEIAASSSRNEKAPEKKQPEPAKNPVTEEAPETAFISRGTRIEGNFFSRGGAVIGGELLGNLTSESGKVVVTGKIQGDVKCESCELDHAVIVGNIQCRETLVVGAESQIQGDISGKKLDMAGNVIGNVIISGSVVLESTSSVTGDVTAGAITVNQGASIQGSMKVDPHKKDAKADKK